MADDESDTETKFVLQNAAIIGEFYSALRDLKLPDVLIFELVADYHREVLLMGDFVPLEDD